MQRLALPLALLIPLLAACSSGASTTAEAPSSTPSVHTTTVPPPATTATASPEELAQEGPSISEEDMQKGIEEGNIYVVYSGVMCFGGTLVTLNFNPAPKTCPSKNTATTTPTFQLRLWPKTKRTCIMVSSPLPKNA